MKDTDCPKDKDKEIPIHPRDERDRGDDIRSGGENPPEPIDRRPAPTPRPPDPPKGKKV